MKKLQRTKLLAIVVAAAVICCMFAACKKDPGDDISTTEGSSRSAWLDETVSGEEAPPTEIVTDENGETKVVEYETDAQGEIATEANGEKVTKPASAGGTQDPAAPVNGNTTTTTTKAASNGNTTTTTKQHTTTTTRPNTTTTTTQPAPPPPVQTELTAADKEAMINDLMAYARQVGYKDVYRDDVGEGMGNEYPVNSSNYDETLIAAKNYIKELCGSQFSPQRYINFQWGATRSQWSTCKFSLYIYME